MISRLRAHLNPKFTGRKHSVDIAMQKRTEITIETERFLVVSRRRNKPMLWCSECDNQLPMLTVIEAARTAGTTSFVISELAEAGKLHMTVTLDGQRFICSNSLAAARAEGAS